MSDAGGQRLSRAVQARFGLPETFKTVGPFPFAGMNTQASRLAIQDNEAWWQENYIKTGEGNVRTVPDLGDPIYTATSGRKIVSFDAYNIGFTDYFAVFFDDGSALQVNYATGAVTDIVPAGTRSFYTAGGPLPATVQWGSIYLLIANRNTANDYWAWDGSILYTAGGISPVVILTSSGANYVAAPTITTFGGHGSGISLSADISNGAVTHINVLNPGTGYVVGDIVQAIFSGGGSDTAARLTASFGGGGLIGINVLTGGTGYGDPPTVQITGGGGIGAAAHAEVSGGVVVSVVIDEAGSGFVSAPAIAFIPITILDGSGATGAAVIAGGGVALNAIIVLAGGTGYLAAPTVTITGGGGSGAAAHAVMSGTSVASVVIDAAGSGFASAPVIGFTPTSGGSGAIGQATLVAGPVGTISVTDGGTNFSGIPTLTITGGGGSGAKATAVLGGPGPLKTIKVTFGGSGYTSLPTIDISDPTGAGATAIVTGVSAGVITAITVTNEGSSYTNPTITFSSGSATATGAVGAGSIVSVILDNRGEGYTDVPAVIVEAGLNQAASAILDLMPFGVSGHSIETYLSQVWLQHPFQSGAVPNGGVRLSSAPNSISNFAASAGGLTETSTDRFLRKHLTAIRQANGFLYPFGDSSAGVISNVQVSAATGTAPPSKTLTNQNTDPQTGTNWGDSIQDFSRTIVFANPFGVFGLFGGAVTKISGNMDRIFADALFPTTEFPDPSQPVTPSSAVANLYNRRVYLLLMTIKDPLTLKHRNAMVCWNEKDWSIVSQSAALTFIGTQEIDSQLAAWGTDGDKLYPLMTEPSATLEKVWMTKLYGVQNQYILKMGRVVYVQAENFADTTRAPVFDLTIDTEFASFPADSPQIAFPPNAPLPASALPPVVQAPLLMAPTADIVGAEIGLTLRSKGADHAIYSLTLATEDVDVVFG